MISNRMKNKYTLKRKRHILRKKEHVGEKYLADFSGNRKFLSVISVFVLVTAIRQTSAAQDLGGFHVETLPGESTGIPSDWEVGDGDQDFGEQQQSEENGYEDMFGSGEESWQGEIYEEPETVPESGNVSDWENSMENMEETDEEYLEEIRLSLIHIFQHRTYYGKRAYFLAVCGKRSPSSVRSYIRLYP